MICLKCNSDQNIVSWKGSRWALYQCGKCGNTWFEDMQEKYMLQGRIDIEKTAAIGLTT